MTTQKHCEEVDQQKKFEQEWNTFKRRRAIMMRRNTYTDLCGKQQLVALTPEEEVERDKAEWNIKRFPMKL